MTWNNRVIRHINEDADVWYSIHEVHYDQDGNPNGVTENPVPAHGDSVEELTHSMIYQMKALTEPVLDYRMFENQEKETTTDEALNMLKGKNND
jgi:hypothetical protein